MLTFFSKEAGFVRLFLLEAHPKAHSTLYGQHVVGRNEKVDPYQAERATDIVAHFGVLNARGK